MNIIYELYIPKQPKVRPAGNIALPRCNEVRFFFMTYTERLEAMSTSPKKGFLNL
jgi:hypothetical protein